MMMTTMAKGFVAWLDAGWVPWAEMSLKGAVVVSVAAVAVTLMGPGSAARRSLVWTLCLAALVALPVLGALGPDWAVLPAVPTWAARGGVTGSITADRATDVGIADGSNQGRSALERPAGFPSVVTVQADVAGLDRDGSREGVSATTRDDVGRRVESPTSFSRGRERLLPTVEELPGGSGSGNGDAAGQPPVASGGQPFGGAGLLLLWLVGFLGALTPRLVGRLRLEVLGRQAVPVTDPTLLRALATTVRELRVGRPVELLASRRAAMPMTWGSLRPRLLVPAEAESWSRERVRHVFLHELAHVSRWDHLASLLGTLASAVHWFNPVVWCAAGRARLERENACDDRVLTAGCRPSAYARDLLAVARSLALPRGLAVSSIPMARPSQLSARLTSILDPRRGRQGTGPASVTLGVALVALLVIPLSAMVPRRPVSPPVSQEISRDKSDGVDLGEAPVPEAVPVEAVAAPLPSPRSADGVGLAGLVPEPVRDLVAPAERPGTTVLRPASVPARPGQTAVCAGESVERKSRSVSDDERQLQARWSADDCSVSLEIRGDVRFSPEEDAIAYMGPNSYFSLDARIGGERRELEAEPDGSGRPDYTYRVDGDERPFDAQARSWLADLVPQLYRETGYDAEARVERLLAEGGVPAVLEEVGRIESDYVTRLYLGYLIEHGDLSTAQFAEVIALAGRRVDSDYELAELLIHVARTEGLSPAIRDTYLDATATLDSDYEHRRVLAVLLEQPDLEPALVDAVIASSIRIDSDYERAELLIQAQGVAPLSEPGREAYLTALADIDSDYETRRVLDGFLNHGPLSVEELARVMELADHLDSDYELAELLIRVGSENELDGPATKAYLEAVGSIESDYELRRTLFALLDTGDVDDDDLATVLALALDIDSDYERAELLVRVAENHPLTASLRDDYRVAAEGIDSRYEQDRAYAALARSGEARLPRP